MDNTQGRADSNNGSFRGRSSDRGGRDRDGGVHSTMNKAVGGEVDVKKASAPAVSSTYVAETMTVTNNFNF